MTERLKHMVGEVLLIVRAVCHVLLRESKQNAYFHDGEYIRRGEREEEP